MGGENRINSIKEAFMLCPDTKLAQKLLTMHKYYPKAADHVSSAICLGISKRVQIPLQKTNVVTKGVKEYKQFMNDLQVKQFNLMNEFSKFYWK